MFCEGDSDTDSIDQCSDTDDTDSDLLLIKAA